MIESQAKLDFLGRLCYIVGMVQLAENLVVPKDFPGLNMLVWNRDPARPIEREVALALYERNWRFVDVQNLAPTEAALIKGLVAEFGHGHLLAAR